MTRRTKLETEANEIDMRLAQIEHAIEHMFVGSGADADDWRISAAAIAKARERVRKYMHRIEREKTE